MVRISGNISNGRVEHSLYVANNHFIQKDSVIGRTKNAIEIKTGIYSCSD